MVYEWLRALHIFAVIAWMAGLLYLPRLFVYHGQVLQENDTDKKLGQTFLTMENRLLKIIMTPSMLVTWLLGLFLLFRRWEMFDWPVWMILKLVLVLFLSAYHGFLASCLKKFQRGETCYSPRFFKLLNEVPALAALIIVILVVVEPFG